MRIAMVAATETDLSLVDLSGALAGAGHRVEVHSPPAAADAEPAGLRMGAFVAALREQWQVRPPDVVHTHDWSSGLAALLAAGTLGIPVVHSHQDPTRGPVERADVERAVCRAATRVIATSVGDLPALLRSGVRRDTITIVPHGVDPHRFAPNGPRAPRLSSHRLLTTVSEASQDAAGDGDRLDVLLDALAVLHDTELVVVDAPPVAAGRIARTAAAERVLCASTEVAGLPALLRSADLVVCGPWCDRPSLLATQAMACGVAVVGATTDEGLSDVVVPQVTGAFPARPGPAGLARVLSGLLADDAQRQFYAIAGIDRAVVRYAFGRVADETEAVYTSALRGRVNN